MNPVAAVRRNLFNVHLDRRSGRVDWWATRITLFVVTGLVIAWLTSSTMAIGTRGTVLGIWLLFAMLSAVSVTARRLNDLDRPIWILSIPVVAFVVACLPPFLSLAEITQGMLDAMALYAPEAPEAGPTAEQMRGVAIMLQRGVRASYSEGLIGQIGFVALMFALSCRLVMQLVLGFAPGVSGPNRLGMPAPGEVLTREQQRREYVSPELADRMERMERARRIDAERIAREAALRGH